MENVLGMAALIMFLLLLKARLVWVSMIVSIFSKSYSKSGKNIKKSMNPIIAAPKKMVILFPGGGFCRTLGLWEILL